MGKKARQGVTVEQVLEPSYFTLLSRLQSFSCSWGPNLLGVRSFLVCSSASANSKLLRCVGCGVMYFRSPEQLELVFILLKPSCLVVVHDLTGGVVNSVTVNC